MSRPLPYVPSNRNIGELFEKIAAARTPDAISQTILSEMFGLKSTNDRQLISLLKTLGFLDQGGRPTHEYGQLKNKTAAPKAIAKAVKKAYEPLFAANENANDLPTNELKGLIAQVAGTDDEMSGRIASTFSTLTKLGHFKDLQGQSEPAEPKADSELRPRPNGSNGAQAAILPLRGEFHFNLQIHLPSNGSEETYLSIFNALRKTFS